MSINYVNLSFHDLMQFPAFKIAAKTNDREAMERILWELGMDITQPYEINQRLHRALTTNTPIDGLRVEGLGRTDKEWLQSGFASLEDYMASSNWDMQKELRSLSKEMGLNSAERNYDVVDYDIDEEETMIGKKVGLESISSWEDIVDETEEGCLS